MDEDAHTFLPSSFSSFCTLDILHILLVLVLALFLQILRILLHILLLLLHILLHLLDFHIDLLVMLVLHFDIVDNLNIHPIH